MSELGLYVWGKKYTTPKLLRAKVVQVSAGENHILLTTGNQSISQFLRPALELAAIDSDSWVSDSYGFIRNP